MLYKEREKIRFLKSTSKKIGLLFSKIRITPNQWSLLVLVFAIAAAYFMLEKRFVLAGFFILLSSFFDIVDGAVARVTKRYTKFGAYLDTIIDRYSELIFILPLAIIDLPAFILPATFWLFLYFFGGLMTTYAKAAAKEKELVREELKGGILERAERVSLLAIGIFLATLNIFYLTCMIVLLAVLSNISALQRIYLAFQKSKSY